MENGAVAVAVPDQKTRPDSSVSPISVSTNNRTQNRQRRFSSATPTSLPKPSRKGRVQGCAGEVLEHHVLAGLTIAGVASSILHTAVTFYAEPTVAMVVGRPPPHGVSASRMILQTGWYVTGAWWIEETAARRQQTDFVGAAGMLTAAVVLVVAPWFGSQGWGDPSWVWECLRAIYILLLAAPVLRDHRMTEAARFQFLASGQFANFATAWVVRNLGHARVRDDEDRRQLVLRLWVTLAGLLFVVAQNTIAGSRRLLSLRHVFFPPRVKVHDDEEDDGQFQHSAIYKRHWRLWRIIRDISRSKRFRVWIGMEVLMEGQISFFRTFFIHTYAYRVDGEVNLNATWILYMTIKFTSIMLYLPMLRFGYKGVYKALFYVTFGVSIFVLATVNTSSSLTYFYILTLIFPILTGAVHGAGFQLAMADMSLELHQAHTSDGRFDEPSLAGLLVGANAFICKPTAYLFALVATKILDSRPPDSKLNAFHIFVITPLFCSCVQVLIWKHYDLTPKQTATMREELHQQLSYDSTNQFGDSP